MFPVGTEPRVRSPGGAKSRSGGSPLGATPAVPPLPPFLQE